MTLSLSLDDIINRIDLIKRCGSTALESVSGIASVAEAIEGDLTFVASPKRKAALQATQASVALVAEGIEVSPKEGQLFLVVKRPSLELAKICDLVAARLWPRKAPGIHPTAIVAASAQVDASAYVGPFVTIEEGSVIGPRCQIEARSQIGAGCALAEDCHLSANVVLERDTELGARVRIHSGAVVGSDGFGYEFEAGRHRKVPQVGNVVIGADVEIGSNTTIDRGRFGPTRIGEGTKIDNQVQIGHNVQIGRHCILCAQVGIAGSTTIKDYVVFGGRAGASGHLTIESGAQLAGTATAFSDLAGNAKYGGNPALPLMTHQRLTVLSKKLPDFARRLKHLEGLVSEL